MFKNEGTNNARAIDISNFDDHAIHFIPILRWTIILWDMTISSREVNLDSSMKINQILTSLCG